MTQPEQRQVLVDTFINAIYLYDDKVLITFNYKEGTETVAFGEAVKAEKSSDMSARGAPDIERQIVRFDVLFYVEKRLHTVCTFARIRGFSTSFRRRFPALLLRVIAGYPMQTVFRFSRYGAGFGNKKSPHNELNLTILSGIALVRVRYVAIRKSKTCSASLRKRELLRTALISAAC